MINPIADKTYRHQVLSGQLKGPGIKATMETVFAGKITLSLMYAQNAFLLWHMANCPRKADREQVLGLAEEFDAKVLTRMKGSLECFVFQNNVQPLPHTPVPLCVNRKDAVWRRRVFPQATVREKEGLALVMEDRVPAYSEFFVTEETMRDFDSARKALMFRNRCFVASCGEIEVDLMHLSNMELSGVANVANVPEEALVCFAKSIRLGKIYLDFLFCLLVKNQLPIGYGVASPDELSGSQCNIWVHIFPEYRGTISSSNLFKLLLVESGKKFKPKDLMIKRFLNPILQISAEEEEASTRFYLKHGFRWLLPPDQAMILSAP